MYKIYTAALKYLKDYNSIKKLIQYTGPGKQSRIAHVGKLALALVIAIRKGQYSNWEKFNEMMIEQG